MIRVPQGMLAVRLLLFGALAASLSAQIGYPGGGYPGGGRGGPMGGGGPIGGGGRGKTGNATPSNSKGRKDAPVVITTTGILRTVTGNQFVLEADDHRIITYKSGDKMTIQKDTKPVELSSFATGDHLSVDSTTDDRGFFTATGVTFSAAGTTREREEASRTWDLPNLARTAAKRAAENKRSGDGDDERPTLRRKGDDAAPPQQSASTSTSASHPAQPATATTSPTATAQPAAEPDDNRPTTLVRPADPTPDADDPGRPELRHGKPAPRVSARNTEPEPPSLTPSAGANQPPSLSPTDNAGPAAAAPDVIPVQEDPIIVKAKEAASAFVGVLPDFFCRQLTTRYESDRPKDGWQAIDTISADLAYENGQESYTNIKVGNKPEKSMEDAGGNWSTGEFASLLDDLFDPSTAAIFRKTGQDTISGRNATTFKFDVTREHSHWRISIAAQLYYPAFRGTVWIDRQTSRVLRLEIDSRNMPLLFPLVKVEEAVDYEFVRLATPQPFLLPTVSEVLSCQQGSSHCSRNRIEFRNYRKFGAESGITFDEKQ